MYVRLKNISAHETAFSGSRSKLGIEELRTQNHGMKILTSYKTDKWNFCLTTNSAIQLENNMCSKVTTAATNADTNKGRTQANPRKTKNRVHTTGQHGRSLLGEAHTPRPRERAHP